MAVSVDDAFLGSLLDGLDADTFNTPPSSSPKRSSPLTKAKPLYKPKPALSSVARPAHLATPGCESGVSGSKSQAGVVGVEKGARGPTTRAPTQASHFWERVDSGAQKLGEAAGHSHPPANTGRASSSKGASLAGGMSRHRPAPAPAPARVSRTPASATISTPPRKPPRTVSIELERAETQQAAPPSLEGQKLSVVGKGRAVAGCEVDFHALCDGMDWEEDISFSPVKKPKAGTDQVLLSLKAVDAVPHSQQFIRCTVTDIVDGVDSKTRRPQKTLYVELDGSETSHQVILKDDWLQTAAEEGDIVNLIGDFDRTATPALAISRTEGLLILHPDILVSSTKVADSSHCARKALLQELIRTSAAESTPALAYGNMLHELMQACFLANAWDDSFIRDSTREIVEREIGAMWGIRLDVDQAIEEMHIRSERFRQFADTFVGARPGPSAFLSDLRASSNDPRRARLSVTRTLEVEEDIWSPKYGLKGKIDVSVTARVAEGPVVSEPRTMPFEIKTGKSVAGMEHRAQTMLYTLLMSDRYDDDIDSGLLYYSQGGELIRVRAARNEIRGLIIARNEFATYLHRRGQLSKDRWEWPNTNDREEPPAKDDDVEVEVDEFDLELEQPALEDDEQPALLPAPIDEHRSCKWCYVQDACMLYRRAVEGELAIDAGNADNALQTMYEAKTGHLTDSQADFFRHWENLISLEEQELVKFKKEIWTMSALDRARLGRCLAEMKVDESFMPARSGNAGARIHSYTYRLQPAQAARQQGLLLGGSIGVNDPVVVSLEQPRLLALSRGFVLEITAEAIVLGLDRSLTDSPRLSSSTNVEDLVFRVDKDELAAGLGRIRDNLVQLFVAKTGDEERLRLVVDLAPPAFADRCSPAAQDRIAAARLNSDQRSAIDLVLRAQDYALILGMPGTGKTTTIAEVLKQLAAEGKSVLLTSYTHSAVDNILLKLVDTGLNILRLGNRDKIMPALHRFTLDPERPASTIDELEDRLMRPQIVATTCLGINDPIFARRKFDLCIVDEASQVTLPTCLGPLRFAHKFVLVGDHYQLPPLVKNQAARAAGLDISLFKRLSDAHPHAVANLTEQYRMNGDIMHLSNRMVYEGRLKAGSSDVDSQQLAVPRPGALASKPSWIQAVLDPARAVVFLDTDALPARERKAGPLIDNPLEADIIHALSSSLIEAGVPASQLGIIAPYRHQIKLLSGLHAHQPEIEILTADRSQGRDKETILMSMTRSNAAGQVGDLLADWRRWNVCLTRAKSKLVVVGSRSTLATLELMQNFFEVIDDASWELKLTAGAVVGITGDAEGEGEDESQKRRVKVERFEGEMPAGAKKARRSVPAERAIERPLVKDVLNELV